MICVIHPFWKDSGWNWSFEAVFLEENFAGYPKLSSSSQTVVAVLVWGEDVRKELHTWPTSIEVRMVEVLTNLFLHPPPHTPPWTFHMHAILRGRNEMVFFNLHFQWKRMFNMKTFEGEILQPLNICLFNLFLGTFNTFLWMNYFAPLPLSGCTRMQ